jgi:alpha-amylase
MQEWIKITNIYEVNLRQYTPEGTIRAFAAHLPRLKDMGVDTLWFMPITPISQKNKKGTRGSYYACADYTSVAEEFGTLEDFKSLVDNAHKMGFKVILDWVANHTGWDHHWTVEHPDWYEKDGQTGEFKKASGMDDIIELDFKNPSLRSAMIEAMKFWVTETDIDGFRCDLAFWVEADFWKEAKPLVDAVKPMFWLGELDSLDSPEYMQVFDAAYTWKWMHYCEKYYKGQASFDDLLQVLEKYHQAPGLKAWFTTNHDENTWNGTEYEKYGELARSLAVFSCTWPGMPLIYSGQEAPNYKRLAFFEKDVIEWKERCELHEFYKALLTLKKTNPALATDASLEIEFIDAGRKLLVFKRQKEGKEVVVGINFSGEETGYRLPNLEGTYRNLVSGELIAVSSNNDFKLPSWGFSIWIKQEA